MNTDPDFRIEVLATWMKSLPIIVAFSLSDGNARLINVAHIRESFIQQLSSASLVPLRTRSFRERLCSSASKFITDTVVMKNSDRCLYLQL